jgi:hypothetical protein
LRDAEADWLYSEDGKAAAELTMRRAVPILIAVALGVGLVAAQSPFAAEGHGPAQLLESGRIAVDGRDTPYVIRHLPVNSFPDLPLAIQQELTMRGCLIPQTYEARRPENVVHASLEGPGASDWAVLCSVRGMVSLLVFFDGSANRPAVLATALETKRLQTHDPSGVLGFNWGIDPATPQAVADAQAGISPRPPRLDHDALADSVVDRNTVYHFYAKSAWTVLDAEE